MEGRETRRELDAFDQDLLRRIEAEKQAWQPIPPAVSMQRMQARMRTGDRDRLLLVLAFLSSVLWMFFGGVIIAVTWRVSPWVTFALSAFLYSMLLSVLYMVVLLKTRRKSKEVTYE